MSPRPLQPFHGVIVLIFEGRPGVVSNARFLTHRLRSKHSVLDSEIIPIGQIMFHFRCSVHRIQYVIRRRASIAWNDRVSPWLLAVSDENRIQDSCNFGFILNSGGADHWSQRQGFWSVPAQMSSGDRVINDRLIVNRPQRPGTRVYGVRRSGRHFSGDCECSVRFRKRGRDSQASSET